MKLMYFSFFALQALIKMLSGRKREAQFSTVYMRCPCTKYYLCPYIYDDHVNTEIIQEYLDAHFSWAYKIFQAQLMIHMRLRYLQYHLFDIIPY